MSEKEEEEALSSDQEEEEEEEENRPALGLTLRKTQSFVEELERQLYQTWNNNNTNNSIFDDEGAENHPPPPQINSSPPDFMSQPMSEKLKASNFSASMLRIGGFERVSRHESDLVAKLYYAKRKLVWEFLEGPLKKKIEIQWSDIGAMRATIEDGQPGIWEIELNQPPLFFNETNPQPRKHTLWQPVGDFTNGQASRIRRHFVKFPRGVLDKHYEKLLQCDPRLHMLSQQPFPTHNPNMFFVHQPTNNSYEVSGLCLDFHRHAMPNTPLINLLTNPNPYHHHLTFPAASHMNVIIPQNNNNNYNWLLHNNNNEAQSSSSSLSAALPLPDTTLVYPTTHEYPYHMLDNQVVTNYNNYQTMVVGNASVVPGDLGNNNLQLDPNMDAVLMSFYRNNNILQNQNNVVSNGQAMPQGTLLYHHGSSPWVSSHFTNGDDHSPPSPARSTGDSASSSPASRIYPNQDFRRRST